MTTATLPVLTMPLRSADQPGVPTWSPKRFSRAIEAERARSGERRTQVVLRLAQVTDTSGATIYNWRKGAGRPDVDEALLMAAALHVELSDLLE